jgi:hypothetical protein
MDMHGAMAMDAAFDPGRRPYRYCSEAEARRRQEQCDVHWFEASDGMCYPSIVDPAEDCPCSCALLCLMV